MSRYLYLFKCEDCKRTFLINKDTYKLKNKGANIYCPTCESTNTFCLSTGSKACR